MSSSIRNTGLFAIVALLFVLIGATQSWTLSLTVLSDALIVAIVALGLNMQWGYAGLFNTGIAGFFALGGLGMVLASQPFDAGAWTGGGLRIVAGLVVGALILLAAVKLWRGMKKGRARSLSMIALLVVGFFLYRYVFDAGVSGVEAIHPDYAGNIGGLGLPVLVAWLAGGLLAAAAAWAVAKTALGLRSDYLAIATLGIGQIIIAVMKNEDWLDRGVKNITHIERWPVPYEVDLQKSASFVAHARAWGMDPRTASTVFVDLCFCVLFLVVLLVLLWLAEMALNSPWGRMMRAIRDNEVSAEAMGKDVKARHLHVFILGSAVIGIAGAMFVTLHGLLSPVSYDDPLRYTFLIWVMVIVGGSGNNWGSVLGGLIIMMLWDEAENIGPRLLDFLTWGLPTGPLKDHLLASAVQMRLPMVGIVLLLVLRFAPRGLIPEK